MIRTKKRKIPLKRGLEPGDVILMTPGKPMYAGTDQGTFVHGIVERIVRTTSQALQGGYTHSAIYVGKGKIVDSRPGYGVQERPLVDALSEVDGARVLRPKATRGVRRKSAKFAKSVVGRPYDDIFVLGKAVSLIAPEKVRKSFKKGDTPEESSKFTCSNMIAAAYEASGFRIRDDDRDWSLTIPADFMDKKKSRSLKILGRRKLDRPLLGRALDVS